MADDSTAAQVANGAKARIAAEWDTPQAVALLVLAALVALVLIRKGFRPLLNG